MANIKLDFSKMKHLSSDKDSTTLQHPSGHQITLKHSALSPDNQKQLMALSGIAKDSATPAQQDQMRHKMAEGGQSKNTYNTATGQTLTPDQRTEALIKQYNPVFTDKPYEPTTWDKIESGVNQFGKSIKKAVGADQYAQGGMAPENDATTVIPDKGYGKIIIVGDNKAAGGEIKPQPQQELNYKDLMRKKKDMNYVEANKPVLPKKKLAEGGHPGEETCQACGGPIRKAYADQNEPVSQDDDAPQVPTNLDPSSAGAPAVVPNYRDPNQATKEPLNKQDTDTARTKEIYNRMVSNVIPKGMTAPITAAQFGEDGQAPKQFDAQNWMKSQKEETDEKAMNAAAIAEQQQKTIQENQARVSAGLAPLPVPDVPNGPQIPGTPENPPQPNAINPSGQPVDPMDSGMEATATMMQQGFMDQMSGISGTADAQARQAAMQAKALDFNAKAEQDLLSKYQNNSDAIQGEMDAVRNDIANSHITPDNYWKGDSDGNGSHSKIATGIGMILAGFNPTNKPNAAIDFLNKQMEMNLQAQIQEMGKKQNVLTSLNSKFHNMNDTMTFARMVNNQMLQSQLASAAAKAMGGPNGLAHAQAQQAIGQLQMQYAPLQQKLQMSQTMMHIANDSANDPDMQVAQATKLARYMTAMGDPTQAKQWQDATVPGVGVTRNLAPVPQDVRQKLIAHQTLAKAATELQAFIQSHGGLLDRMSQNERAQAAAMVLPVQAAFREGTLGTVYREGEQPLLDRAVKGQPLDFASYLINTEPTKIQTMLKTNEEQSNILKKAYGLPIRQSETTQDQSQTKTVNGITYKRGPNGEAIRVN